MGEKQIGISQQTLVSNAGTSEKARRLPQYVAALSSTLGALAAGTVLAWTASAGTNGVNLASKYDIEISATQFSWIGAIVNLGAAVICIPIGLLCDMIGRKTSMLILVVPFTIGWGLIIWANSVTMLLVGRFITGLSGGAFCVTAPMYAGEIAEPEIRGTLGSYFQLLLTVGILFSYTLGNFVDMFVLSIVSAIFPLIFFGVFFFMPETPTYYLKKGNESAARASMVRLRGPRYNIEPEIQAQKEALAEAERQKIPFLVAIRSSVAIKGLYIAFGLMIFQQLSGVNAVIFYAGSIFEAAGSSLSSGVSTIIVGVMQVAAVFVSSLIVDKLGRKILLLFSDVAMAICALTIGIYFYLKDISKSDVTSIGWLPLVAVCVFIVTFSLGYGPIPWMMMGEIFAPGIKGIAGSSACFFNWILAFIVTKFYNDMVVAFGTHVTFWIFSGVCVLGCFFVVFVVPETKGKSLQQIQEELGANPLPGQQGIKA